MTIPIKKSLIFVSLLFSVQVGESMAGVMRSLRDIETTYYVRSNDPWKS